MHVFQLQSVTRVVMVVGLHSEVRMLKCVLDKLPGGVDPAFLPVRILEVVKFVLWM